MGDVVQQYTQWMLQGNYYSHLLPVYQEMVSHLTTQLGIQNLCSAECVADLGSGLGYTCSMIRRLNEQVRIIAVDPSGEMLNQLKTRKQLNIEQFIQSKAEALRSCLKERPAVILSSFALHHVSHHDKPQMLEQLFDLLLQGGKLGIGEISVDTTIQNPLDQFEHLIDFFTYGAKHIARSTGNAENGKRELQFMMDTLEKQNEHFLTSDQWICLFKKAGFKMSRPYFSKPKAMRYFHLIGTKPTAC